MGDSEEEGSEDLARYANSASDAIDAIQEALEGKRRAIMAEDYREAYRLAGVASLLCREQERIDREVYIELYPEENHSESSENSESEE